MASALCFRVGKEAARMACLLLVSMAAWSASIEAEATGPAGEPVADVAVVLEPLGTRPPARNLRVTIEQKNREFSPYLTVIQRNTAVDFPNRDPLKHHIYSFSPAKVFEVKLYQGQPAQPVVFDQPGEIVLGCNIHDWMEAHILVVDTPYFGKTGIDGRLHLAAVPPGRYRLRVWHPRQITVPPEREMEVGQSAIRLPLAVSVAPRQIKPRPAPGSDHY